MKSFIQRHLSTLNESDALLTEAFNSKPYEITMTKKGASDILFGFETSEGTEYQIRFRNFPKLGKNIRRVTVRQKQGNTFKDVVKKFDDGMRVMATMIAAVEMFVTTPMGKATDGFALDMSKKAAPRASKIFTKALKRNKVFKKHFDVVDTIAGSDEAVTTAWAVAKGKSASEVFSGPDAEGLLPDSTSQSVPTPTATVEEPSDYDSVVQAVLDYLQTNYEISTRKTASGSLVQSYLLDMGQNVVMVMDVQAANRTALRISVSYMNKGFASAYIDYESGLTMIHSLVDKMMKDVNAKFADVVKFENGLVKGHLKGKRVGKDVIGTFAGHDVEFNLDNRQLTVGNVVANNAPVDDPDALLAKIIDMVNDLGGDSKVSKTEAFVEKLRQSIENAGLNVGSVTTITKGQMIQVYSNKQLIRTVNVVSDESAKLLGVRTPAKPWRVVISQLIPAIEKRQKESGTPPSVKRVSKKGMVMGFIDKHQPLEEKYRAFNLTVEGNAVGGMTYGYISIDIKGTPEDAGKQLKQILRKEGLKPLKVETMEGDDSNYYGDWGAAVATFEILLGESANKEGAFSKFLKTKV
ncbi:hypothetical protein GR28A_00076 [Vibrio phage vB_VcorM_GR28A]|nr:hypothetical protein GR28A_00076 [Vibrio phage vB_VcorM_GR28A]